MVGNTWKEQLTDCRTDTFMDNSCFETREVNKPLGTRFQLILIPVTCDSNVSGFQVIKLHYSIHCATHVPSFLFKSLYIFRRKSALVVSYQYL